MRDYNVDGIVKSFTVGGGVVAAVGYDNGVSLFNEGSSTPYTTGNPGPAMASDLILTDSHLFVMTADFFSGNGNRLYALDLQNGQPVWDLPVNATGLALGDGYLFVSGRNGITAIAVPEPAALFLLALACSRLVLLRRRFS